MAGKKALESELESYKEDYNLCIKEFRAFKEYLLKHHQDIIKEYDDYRLSMAIGFTNRDKK